MRPAYKRKALSTWDSAAEYERAAKQARMQENVYRSLPRGGRPSVQSLPINRAGYSSVARTRGAAATGEMKYFDCELYGGSAISACGTSWITGTRQDPTATIDLGAAAVNTPECLFAPTMGAALNQRIGRKCHMYKVKLHGLITIPGQASQSAADAAPLLRAFLVMDQQTNAAAMTPAQLMNDGSAADSTINSFQNPNNFGRFRVLREKKWTISNTNMTGAVAGIVQAAWTIQFKMNFTFKQPVVVTFNATTGGTVADIIDNSLHFIIGTNSTALNPTISYYSRVCYKE